MLINVEQVKVTDRIRKDFGNIEELAQDINENGLINPPVVTPDYQLIAGERRLRACKHLGWQQVEVRIMTVKDRLQFKRLEVNENALRKDFTFSEMMDAARELERLERLKAEERMNSGKPSPKSDKGRTDAIVAKTVCIGGKTTYREAKFVSENADAKTIEALDNGEISIHKAYTDTKKKLEETERTVRVKDAEIAKLTHELGQARKQPQVIEKEVIVEKPIIKEVSSESDRRRIVELERKYKEVDAERNALESSLAETYTRLQELEKRDRVSKLQHESPLYDVYRSLSASNGYLKAVTENERFADEVIASAENQLLDKFEVEIRQLKHHFSILESLIDARRGVVVIEEHQIKTLEVIEYANN